MTLQIYDTAKGEIASFAPGPVVRIYVCGITPYDSTHLGHASTYLAHDVLIRRLEELGHEVEMVRNFTDVDDPLFTRARERSIDALELAQIEIQRFWDDIEALNLRPAVAEPRVTTSIPEILRFIARLDEVGCVYEVEGTVYFDVAKSPRFGLFSGLTTNEMIALSAKRGGTPDDERQRNPLDFVLWRPSLPDEPAWESAWGPGRPGWHIECSAMALEHLGSTIDLHGGGSDLVFPHHECEIAQSEALSDKPFANHWMHVGMVAYHGEKMSKSLGNLVFVSELRDKYDPRAIRLAVHQYHYRHGFEWFDNDIQVGVKLLELLQDAARATAGPAPDEFTKAFRARIDDDLDTPGAIALLREFARAMTAGDETSGAAPDALRDAALLLGVEL